MKAGFGTDNLMTCDTPVYTPDTAVHCDWTVGATSPVT